MKYTVEIVVADPIEHCGWCPLCVNVEYEDAGIIESEERCAVLNESAPWKGVGKLKDCPLVEVVEE